MMVLAGSIITQVHWQRQGFTAYKSAHKKNLACPAEISCAEAGLALKVAALDGEISSVGREATLKYVRHNLGARCSDRDGKAEGRALAGGALEPHLAAVQLDKPFAD